MRLFFFMLCWFDSSLGAFVQNLFRAPGAARMLLRRDSALIGFSLREADRHNVKRGKSQNYQNQPMRLTADESHQRIWIF